MDSKGTAGRGRHRQEQLPFWSRLPAEFLETVRPLDLDLDLGRLNGLEAHIPDLNTQPYLVSNQVVLPSRVHLDRLSDRIANQPPHRVLPEPQVRLVAVTKRGLRHDPSPARIPHERHASAFPHLSNRQHRHGSPTDLLRGVNQKRRRT